MAVLILEPGLCFCGVSLCDVCFCGDTYSLPHTEASENDMQSSSRILDIPGLWLVCVIRLCKVLSGVRGIFASHVAMTLATCSADFLQIFSLGVCRVSSIVLNSEHSPQVHGNNCLLSVIRVLVTNERRSLSSGMRVIGNEPPSWQLRALSQATAFLNFEWRDTVCCRVFEGSHY